MYLAIDIGGTKTLLAVFNSHGQVKEELKFKTNKDYQEFLNDLKINIAQLMTKKFSLCCAAVPGRLDRQQGLVFGLGNLPWQNKKIVDDIQSITKCRVIIENDAKLAALSEAQFIKDDFKKVLYITISTGIGTGVITNGVIDDALKDSEGGQIFLSENGSLKRWETLASGKAILKHFGKEAREIKNQETWHQIAKDLSVGLFDQISIIQPDAVVFGGPVGDYFNKFSAFLKKELKKMSSPLIPIPKIFEARRPNEAVIYGCFELIKQHEKSN